MMTYVIDKVSSVPTSDVVAEIAAICCTHVAPAPVIIRHSVETEPSIRRLKRDETVSACGDESRKLIPANSQNGLKLPLARNAEECSPQ